MNQLTCKGGGSLRPFFRLSLSTNIWRCYLTDSAEFLEAKEAVNFPREKLMLLCTGCQGEPLAATARLAAKSHQAFKMQQGDTMI